MGPGLCLPGFMLQDLIYLQQNTEAGIFPASATNDGATGYHGNTCLPPEPPMKDVIYHSFICLKFWSAFYEPGTLPGSETTIATKTAVQGKAFR